AGEGTAAANMMAIENAVRTRQMEHIPGSKRWKRLSVVVSLIIVGLICCVGATTHVDALQSRDRAPASQPQAHHLHLSAKQLAAPRTWKTHAAEFASSLTWSPDGRWAAYRLQEELDHPLNHGGYWERNSLCIIRADGSGAQRLYTEHDNDEPEVAG